MGRLLQGGAVAPARNAPRVAQGLPLSGVPCLLPSSAVTDLKCFLFEQGSRLCTLPLDSAITESVLLGRLSEASPGASSVTPMLLMDLASLGVGTKVATFMGAIRGVSQRKSLSVSEEIS